MSRPRATSATAEGDIDRGRGRLGADEGSSLLRLAPVEGDRRLLAMASLLPDGGTPIVARRSSRAPSCTRVTPLVEGGRRRQGKWASDRRAAPAPPLRRGQSRARRNPVPGVSVHMLSRRPALLCHPPAGGSRRYGARPAADDRSPTGPTRAVGPPGAGCTGRAGPIPGGPLDGPGGSLAPGIRAGTPPSGLRRHSATGAQPAGRRLVALSSGDAESRLRVVGTAEMQMPAVSTTPAAARTQSKGAGGSGKNVS